MTNRPFHQLIGNIIYRFSGQVKSKGPHNLQPFYHLIIQQENLLVENKEAEIYVFPNLVSTEIWNVLEKKIYEEKKYFFWCEKRVRGWRLRRMEEIK